MAEFVSVEETARRWGVSPRSVRGYCSQGRVPGSVLEGKTWLIPSGAEKPGREKRHSALGKESILDILRREKDAGMPGGLYHACQIELTYNSNHIEGSRLSHEQTRWIFETKTLGASDGSVRVDDIIETVNHFRCVDLVIDSAGRKLTEAFIKQLHFVLRNGTSDSQKSWFKVGGYKMLSNEVGGMDTARPEEVPSLMKALLAGYNAKTQVSLDDILDFHVQFESIHPFQDGNGRVGRLIIFKECLRHGITPFIITEELKFFYYRGLKEWRNERGYLRDTCLTAQDEFRQRFQSLLP